MQCCLACTMQGSWLASCIQPTVQTVTHARCKAESQLAECTNALWLTHDASARQLPCIVHSSHSLWLTHDARQSHSWLNARYKAALHYELRALNASVHYYWLNALTALSSWRHALNALRALSQYLVYWVLNTLGGVVHWVPKYFKRALSAFSQ